MSVRVLIGEGEINSPFSIRKPRPKIRECFEKVLASNELL